LPAGKRRLTGIVTSSPLIQAKLSPRVATRAAVSSEKPRPRVLQLARTATMNASRSQDITGLLCAWSKGDHAALGKLIPLVEAELRRIAKRYLERGRPDPALQTTGLINEAYTRLIDLKQAGWQDRAHFFGVCARIMRSILVDYARARRSAKRGGGARPVPLEDALAVCRERSADVVAVHEALDSLAKVDARKSEVVELRFFGGLSVEQAASVLRVSPQTVMRDWRLAKAWLWRELGREAPHDPGPAAAG